MGLVNGLENPTAFLSAYYLADLVLFLLWVAVESPPFVPAAAVETFLAGAAAAPTVILLKGPMPFLTINIRHQLCSRTAILYIG